VTLMVEPEIRPEGASDAAAVRAGLERLMAIGYQVATLLGDPAYFARFGFSFALARRIEAPHRARGDGFQAIELVVGALDGEIVRADIPVVIHP